MKLTIEVNQVGILVMLLEKYKRDITTNAILSKSFNSSHYRLKAIVPFVSPTT